MFAQFATKEAKVLRQYMEQLTASPRLVLMPISSPPFTAVTPSMCTVRAQFFTQFPQDR